MTAAKAIKSAGEGVVVDTSEQGQMPDIVQQAFRSAGGSLPVVIFADPGMKNIYGTFGHSQLRGQEYRAIFRDTKKKIRDAQKDGSFVTDLGGGGEAVADKGDDEAPAEAVEAPTQRIAVEDGELATWTSVSGTRINAKLVAVENGDVFFFETSAGKEIKATAAQLSVESVQKARKQAGL